MMFAKGEMVVYGRNGICRIMDITTMKMEGVPDDRLYYIVVPVKEGGRIYTPVDNQKIVMRKVLSREEALALIDEIPRIEALWTVNDKLREAAYKDCIKSCDCREWVKIIKTMYLRNQERALQGKRITATDEKYLRLAEESLFAELSLSLAIPKGEIEDFIINRIEKKQTIC